MSTYKRNAGGGRRNMDIGNVRLKINIDPAIKKLADKLLDFCDELLNMFYSDVKTNIRKNPNGGFSRDSDPVTRAESDIEIQAAKIADSNLIVGSVLFGPHAIIRSFGTGSLMDMNNPQLEKYMQSEYWNRLRGTNPNIVGREEGQYINIFGETVVSKGTFAGQSVEEIIRPIAPNYAIQNAENWVFKKHGHIEKQLEIIMKEWIQTDLLSNIFSEEY